ncbi:MAG: DUF3634 family protein [Planctomycetia bacterium]|nr:DUF3634 family protein [Planctomycetia bacterium]
MLRTSFSILICLGFGSTTLAGYGHNWTWKKSPDSTKLKKCVQEMKFILQASPVRLASVDGTGEPTVLESVITFNMKGEEDDIGEPFVFPGRTGFNFCKTNGKDYDAVVTACLLVVLDHFSSDEVAISSDGKMNEEDWGEGIKLYKKVLGRQPKLGKGSAVSEVLRKINLTPSWDISRLWIVFGLLGIGGLVAWYIFNPRPDFTILFQQDGNAYVKGSFPEAYVQAVRTFFKQDMPMKRNVMVKGWNEADGRMRLSIAGSVSDREQQRIRNFFAMLRKK